MRVRAWRYESEWKWGDLVPIKGMLYHFKRKENTQLSSEYPIARQEMISTIPDFLLLFSYNAGCVIGFAYGMQTCIRFLNKG